METKKTKTVTRENGEIKMFGTPHGVNVIDSPVKAKILSILNDGGLSASKIVLLTGKSKSTISAHLKDLLDAGIIDSKPDLMDRRRKIFFIKSRYLGDLSSCERDLEKDIDEYLKNQLTSDDPFKFFKFIFRTIRVALIKEGVNIDPILHNAGFKVGETYYDKLKDSKTDKLTKNIASFWENNMLGHIEVEKLEPLTIRAYDCFECEDLPQIGRPACAFDSGILEAVFSAHYHQEVGVEEIKCYAQGDNYCSFVIKKKNE
jgi:uncharacterized protein